MMGLTSKILYRCHQKYANVCKNLVQNVEVTSNNTAYTFKNINAVAVCCGVRGVRALASYTDVRGFEPQCGDRLSSLTC